MALLAIVPASLGAQQRYWYDAGVRRDLWAEPGLSADFSARRHSAKAQVLAPAGLAKPAAAEDSTVFRDGPSSGAGLRALAGGVIVRLRPGTGPSEREALFARHALALARPIGAQDRVWLVAAPQGVDSLELANRLHESGDFESASPNWWKERARK